MPIRLLCLVLLLALASCSVMPDAARSAATGGSPLIDEPTPPFPYNSRFCL